LVLAYVDVRSGLVDERLTADRLHRFADRAPAAAVAAVRRHAPWLISGGDSDYEWIRPVVQAGLRTSADAASKGMIAQAAGELAASLVARGRFDVAGDYALALSGQVLADFLGVDRRDAARLLAWGDDLITFFNDVEISVPASERMARSAAALVDFALHRLTATGARSGDGFLALAARAAADRDLGLAEESVGMITLPFLTGTLGVAHLVVNTVWLLLTHADQRARLTEDPSLISGAVGEALRLIPPVALVPRVALERVALGGAIVESGETVYLSLAAANRDPARFSHPGVFDITRPQAGALAFGYGAHSCIGAGLARMQTAIAVEALLRRAPDLALDPEGEVTWSTIPGLQTPQKLDVRAGHRTPQ
jgi:cytochrome P450